MAYFNLPSVADVAMELKLRAENINALYQAIDVENEIATRIPTQGAFVENELTGEFSTTTLEGLREAMKLGLHEVTTLLTGAAVMHTAGSMNKTFEEEAAAMDARALARLETVKKAIRNTTDTGADDFYPTLPPAPQSGTVRITSVL